MRHRRGRLSSSTFSIARPQAEVCCVMLTMCGLEESEETVRTAPMVRLSRGAMRATGDKSMMALAVLCVWFVAKQS